VLAGELDAALLAGPVAEAPFERVPIYDEEMVIIAAANHPPIRSPGDARPQTVLAFEAGCSYRQRLEDWFAHHGEMPDRIVEISSYHAMLGCVVAGMGISLLPRNVLATFPDAKLLSVHALPPELSRVETLLIWRKGTASPKLRALTEVLLAHSDIGEKSGRKRKLGQQPTVAHRANRHAGRVAAEP
jgi:DNA-binding transcriptional LysR family regulator